MMTHSRYLRFPFLLFCIATVFSVLVCFHFSSQRNDDISTVLPTTPWRAVGGCGLGGSGGIHGGSIRWVGHGVSGYLFSVECLPQFRYGRTYGSFLTAPRITFHGLRNTDFAITLPNMLTVGEAQYQSNLDDVTHVNGGPGDITADAAYAFGTAGNFSLRLSCTFPTGEYDVRHGSDQSKRILPVDLQTGRGIYTAGLRFSYTHTMENSLLMFDGTFHYPFNLRLNKKNEYLDGDYRAYRSVEENRERFYYRRRVKPYGENDRGAYFPPSLQLDAVYSWHREAIVVHSLQASFSAPFGTQWVHSPDPVRYDPFPDPDHSAWTLFLGYGFEYSRFTYPLFAGFGFPVRDRRGGNNDWDGIDRESLFREWVITAGFTVGIL